jgi:UDP-N-acetyl-D-mannosaminuronate dehydrogenase
MTKESVLIVGLGEVGRPLFELLQESGRFEVYGVDLKEERMGEVGQKQDKLPQRVEIMHICIACAEKDIFINTVAGYVERFKPKLVIINSTVSPGTSMSICKRCNCLVAHSPIRGVHKSLEHMKWELRRWTKYIGGVDAEAGEKAREQFEALGLKTKALRSSLETELAKLFETTYRAWMIACFQEMHRISRHFSADFGDVVDFIGDTHSVRHDRPVMFPDVIRGHCLVENAQLLRKEYPSKFIELLLESNEKREKEINDKEVSNEIEKVRKRAEPSNGS